MQNEYIKQNEHGDHMAAMTNQEFIIAHCAYFFHSFKEIIL